MAWWMWAIVGMAAVAAELATPAGFYLAGFGAGAFVVAGLVALGLEVELWVELVIFALVSVAGVLGSRLLFGEPGAEERRRDLADLVGEEAVLEAELAGGEVGRVELRGTVWRARHSGTSALPAGSRVRVERVEGVTLIVRGVAANGENES